MTVSRCQSLPRLLLATLTMAAVVVVPAGTALASSAQTIQVNGSEPGRTLLGVGGMSVGGTARLLFDYPQAQRSQILDYLFCTPMVKPRHGYCTHHIYGAGLQRLKVEIGSDTDSVAAEPTIEREPGVVNCNVGYEFKLMAAARNRDPDIKIDALAWGFPGWINPSAESATLGLPPDYGRVFGSQDAVGYLLNYLGCARANGTPVNTLGIWNEIQYLTADKTQSEQWIAGLRQTLDADGYASVQLIADDNPGETPLSICQAPASATDKAFCNAVSTYGTHYPGGGDPATTGLGWLHQNNIYSAAGYESTWTISDTPESTASFTFTGTSIKWIGETQFNMGMADVYLDGQLVAPDVDLYSPFNDPTGSPPQGGHYQQVLYSKSGLPPGQHTIQIVVTGQANPASEGTYVNIDAFAVDGPPDGSATTGPCSVQKCVDDSSPSIQYSDVPPATKPLFASEDAPALYNTSDGVDWYDDPQLRGDWPGASYLAQEINTNYVGMGIVGEDIYTMLSSYYDQEQFAKGGLMIADTPWAAGQGQDPSYDVQSRIWAVAHTTQFTQPGTWRYVGDPSLPSDTASCYLGTSSCPDSTNETGSYVTLRSKQGDSYAIVAETKDATSPQPEQFCLSGGLGTGTVHVWETNASIAFSDVANLTPVNGCFSYTLAPDALYTFTNENTGRSGANTEGYVDRGLSLPYEDNFQSYGSAQTQARYFMDEQGAFETGHRCPAGGLTWCLQQVTTTLPIIWPIIFPTIEEPHTIVGSLAWTNYEVQARLTIPTVGQSASVIGRMQRSVDDEDIVDNSDYQAQVTYEGSGAWDWMLYRVDGVGAQGTIVPLASGTYTNGSSWITLALRMDGSQLTVLLDGKQVGSATDTTYTAGMAGLATGHDGNTYDVVDFDDFCMQALGSSYCGTK